MGSKKKHIEMSYKTESCHLQKDPQNSPKSTPKHHTPRRPRHNLSPSPSVSSLAGKIVPQKLLKQISQARSKSPIEIHQRLYELHSLDQKKRDKNESIRQQNILKEEAK
jgi:hypothetical protein